jgi:hypothetical protein
MPFPLAPADGDRFALDGVLYQFDVTLPGWRFVPNTAGAVRNVNGFRIESLGDPRPSPLGDLDAANKTYVDQTVANTSLWQGVWQVATNVPDLDPAVPPVPLNGYSWTAVTVDPTVQEIAPAFLPGIGGLAINNSDVIIWQASTATYVRVEGSSLSRVVADATYVKQLGDTMTGPLYLMYPMLPSPAAGDSPLVAFADGAGRPLAGLSGYWDGGVAGAGELRAYVACGGSAFLEVFRAVPGNPPRLVLATDPVNPLDAATKGYIDSAYLPLTGGTMTGPILLRSPIVGPGTAPILAFLDGTGRGLAGLVGTYPGTDGGGNPQGWLYAYVMCGVSGWQEVFRAGPSSLPLASPRLTLAGDPVGALDAATKQYVDTAIGTVAYLPLAGGTLTGPLSLPGQVITWGTQGTAPPRFGTRSIGARLALWDNVTATSAGFNIGIDAGTMWFGVDLPQNVFKWYGGTTLFSSLASAGLTLPNDGQGLWLYGGGGLYKRAGTGTVLRCNVGNTQPQIENNDGSNLRAIIDTVNGDARYVNKTGDTMSGALGISLSASGGTGLNLQGPDANLTLPSVTWSSRGSAGAIAVQRTGWNLYGPEAVFRFYQSCGGWGWHQWCYTIMNSPVGVWFEGDVSAASWTTRSEARFKEDITAVPETELAPVFDGLRLVRFRRKPAPDEDMTSYRPQPERPLQYGLLVDDIEQVCPEAIHTTTDPDGKDTMKGWDVAQVIALLVGEVKRQGAELAALRALVTSPQVSE